MNIYAEGRSAKHPLGLFLRSRWLRWAAALLLGLGLLGCNPDKERLVDAEDPVFATTDRSRLFFKNVRLLFYDTEEDSLRRDFFRLADRVKDAPDRPVLNLCIVNDLLRDRAYVMLEPNEFFGTADSIVVYYRDRAKGGEGHYRYRQSNMMRQWQFATDLYNGILQGQEFYVRAPDGREVPFLQEKREREAFRVTMVDYYRMVNIF